jgi:purine-binding chemotaxis protein CheW
LASTVSVPESAADQLVIFRLADRVFGIELGIVREIIPRRPATRLPGAPSYVSGLINVRGTIVTVIDLAARLAAGTAATDGSVILVDHGARVVGLAVDEVLDVQRTADAALVPGAGKTLPQGAGGIVSALGRMDDRVLVMLDAHDIIAQVLA